MTASEELDRALEWFDRRVDELVASGDRSDRVWHDFECACGHPRRLATLCGREAMERLLDRTLLAQARLREE